MIKGKSLTSNNGVPNSQMYRRTSDNSDLSSDDESDDDDDDQDEDDIGVSNYNDSDSPSDDESDEDKDDDDDEEEEEEDDDDDDDLQSRDWPSIRKKITGHLKDEGSTICIQILTQKITKTAKCRLIWKKYASEHDQKKVVESLMRLLLQMERKEGPFSESESRKSKGKPVWNSRKKNELSPAYSLLYQLRYDIDNNGTRKMTTEEIYKIHKIFQQYDYNDFKKYDERMIKLTDKHRKQVDLHIKRFEEHRRMCGPNRSVTSRGMPFWKDHQANNQLRDDTRSGKTKAMKPKELWESNVIYQDFSLDAFRKHIYQEKYKQLAGPYWQKKRNKAALRKHEEEVQKLREEALLNKYDGDMDDIVRGFKSI